MAPKEQKKRSERPPRQKEKLSYKETRELNILPQTIETLEEEKQRLTRTLNSPELYISRDLTKIRAAHDRLMALEKELDEAYHRWDELESLSAKLSCGPGYRGKSDRKAP